MWIDRLLATPTSRAAHLAASFAEQRHRVLAENVANVDTPDYHSQVVDAQAFQDSLHVALQRASSANDARLELRGNAQFQTTPTGQVELRPEIEPAPNVLFHDGTNARVERLLADVNQNGLYFEMSSEFLRGQYRRMLMAIKGRQ
jgi:flagellar basal-body rod protein FlgB